MALVKLFGAFSDLAGWNEREIDAATLGEVVTTIGAADERLAERLAYPSTLVILNATIVPRSLRSPDQPIGAGDELAFGPPVSGG